MLGAFVHNSWIAIFAATGVILSAAYALYLYRRIIFGALVKPSLQAIQDLTAREIAILAPLVVITIALGVYPKPVLDVTTPAVAKLVKDSQAALALVHDKKLAVVSKGAAR
jgi:NADH-quinone oxidoreductase subunit M